MNMKNPKFTSAILAILAFSSASASAAIVISGVSNPGGTPDANTDELAYALFVSTTDLLHGLGGTGGTWNNSTPPAASPDGLNDGAHGGDFTASGITGGLTGAAWAADGAVSIRTFDLGPGSNGTGFNITEIQSIAAWNGAGFANQRYEVYVSLVGNAAFTLLTTVNYQPHAVDGGGSTKVNVTENAGFLATGIDAIRFAILDTTSNNGGGVVMREIDVFGAAAPVPEPATSLLGALGVLGLLRRRR